MSATAKIEGKELIIRLPLAQPPQISASGKSKVIASTHGNQTTELQIEGRPVVIGGQRVRQKLTVYPINGACAARLFPLYVTKSCQIHPRPPFRLHHR